MSDKKKQLPKITYLPKIVQSRPDNALSNKQNKIVRYEVLTSLGRGGFAQCFRVKQMQSNKQYALKVIDKHSENMKKNGAIQRLKNEISILSTLKHEHIIKLHSSFQDTHNYYLVMELCKKISLVQMCRNRAKLHELQVKYFIKQIIKALLYLKQKKIIHRDVKTPNILLDQNLGVKLGDFGLAINQQCKDKNQRYSHCGTPSYMAPQVIKRHKYSYQVDMWSVGVVTYFLIYGEHPFSHKEQKITYEKIEKLQYVFPPQQKTKASIQALDFISKILVLNTQDRLTPQQAMNHSFLLDNIPARLPSQCYNYQIALYILLSYCKESNEQQFRTPTKKNKKQNRYMITRNRSITDYFQQASNSALQNTTKPTKKQRMNKKKQQKRVQQLGEKQIQQKELMRNKQIKQENNAMDHFQVKIGDAENKQEQYLYQNVKQQYNYQENNKVLSNSLVTQKEPAQQDQHLCKKQEKLVKIQEDIVVNQYKNNSRYICQNDSEQNNKESSNDKKEGKIISNRKYQENLQMEAWLDEKLQQQIYIYEFLDKTQLYGIFIHLSNGIKLVKFNDASIMAINQNTRKVLYLQHINRQFQETERLFYKLVIDQKLQDCNSSLSIPVKVSTKWNKYAKNGQKYYTTLFRSTEQPQDETIFKRFEILKQYCRRCRVLNSKTRLPSQQAEDQHELYKFATLIRRWGYQKPKDCNKQYLFLTKTFYQICFDSDTQYFIMRKKEQHKVHKFNKNEKEKKTFLFPIRDRKKNLTPKQDYEFYFIQQFSKNFMSHERANKRKSEEKSIKIL